MYSAIHSATIQLLEMIRPIVTLCKLHTSRTTLLATGWTLPRTEIPSCQLNFIMDWRKIRWRRVLRYRWHPRSKCKSLRTIKAQSALCCSMPTLTPQANRSLCLSDMTRSRQGLTWRYTIDRAARKCFHLTLGGRSHLLLIPRIKAWWRPWFLQAPCECLQTDRPIPSRRTQWKRAILPTPWRTSTFPRLGSSKALITQG